MRLLLASLLLCFTMSAHAADKILNLYTWSEVIPQSVIQQFERETGIKVNYTTYDHNEVLYAKLRASNSAGYDVIEPSSYFVDRMRKQNMLMRLDKTKLSNWHNLNPKTLNAPFDPRNRFSVPFVWGVTGLFVNTRYHKSNLTHWADLWNPQFRDKLLLLDDLRESFSMALMVLDYPMNDENPEHLHEAYLKLKELMPNIKVFSSDTTVSIMIDDDATVGMAWNCDVGRATPENPNLKFIYPQEGYIIWMDNFAIPKNAPHPDNAYKFINFMLRPDIAKTSALYSSYATANLAAQKLMPAHVRNNPRIYPDAESLKHGSFQTDPSEKTMALMEQYWEELKMGG